MWLLNASPYKKCYSFSKIYKIYKSQKLIRQVRVQQDKQKQIMVLYSSNNRNRYNVKGTTSNKDCRIGRNTFSIEEYEELGKTPKTQRKTK